MPYCEPDAPASPAADAECEAQAEQRPNRDGTPGGVELRGQRDEAERRDEQERRRPLVGGGHFCLAFGRNAGTCEGGRLAWAGLASRP